MMKRLFLLLFLLNSLFVFSQIDSAPEFPGGVDKLVEYLSLNTIYPEEAKQKNIEGRVLCEFVVAADGSATNVKVLESVHPSLDAEAIRVIENMPKWNPGIKDGKRVRVRFTLPISFKL